MDTILILGLGPTCAVFARVCIQKLRPRSTVLGTTAGVIGLSTLLSGLILGVVQYIRLGDDPWGYLLVPPVFLILHWPELIACAVVLGWWEYRLQAQPTRSSK